MALSLLTALILQNNEIRCLAMGPFPNNKYGSVAYLVKFGKRVSPVISIEFGKYTTCSEAINDLEDVISAVRKLDLPIQEEELETLFNTEENEREYS